MEELVKALEKVLERGIVVQPQRRWAGGSSYIDTYVIRLADTAEPRVQVEQADNNARGGLTW